MAAFLDFCYIIHRSELGVSDLEEAKNVLDQFHVHREVFRTEVRPTGFSLPRQHSLTHYLQMIQEFSAPNGLCSSITESRHITAIKRPWRRSNRYDALGQMLLTIQCLDKLAAARVSFVEHGMLPPEHPSVSLSAPEVPENKVADDEGLEDEAIDMERVESFMHLPSRRRESDCFELSVLIQNENFIQNEAIRENLPCSACISTNRDFLSLFGSFYMANSI